jgi:hypothetical protein
MDKNALKTIYLSKEIWTRRALLQNTCRVHIIYKINCRRFGICCSQAVPLQIFLLFVKIQKQILEDIFLNSNWNSFEGQFISSDLGSLWLEVHKFRGKPVKFTFGKFMAWHLIYWQQYSASHPDTLFCFNFF